MENQYLIEIKGSSVNIYKNTELIKTLYDYEEWELSNLLEEFIESLELDVMHNIKIINKS